MNSVELSYTDVALATTLILVNGAVSFALRLGLEKSLLLAAIRTVAQLLLVGMVLESVFRFNQWYTVVGMATFMTVVAGVSAESS